MRYQWSRLLYQYKKLPMIRSGDFPLSFGGNLEFELFSFFEISYHLKDWIKNSEEYLLGESCDVEKFVNESEPLKICADICNRLKHSKLRRHRNDKKIGTFNLSLSMEIKPYPECPSMKLTRVTIDIGLAEICCFELAEQCMKEWYRYFEINGIEIERAV